MLFFSWNLPPKNLFMIAWHFFDNSMLVSKWCTWKHLKCLCFNQNFGLLAILPHPLLCINKKICIVTLAVFNVTVDIWKKKYLKTSLALWCNKPSKIQGRIKIGHYHTSRLFNSVGSEYYQWFISTFHERKMELVRRKWFPHPVPTHHFSQPPSSPHLQIYVLNSSQE